MCVSEYVLEQFGEVAEKSANSSRQQSNIQSVSNTTTAVNTTTAAAAADCGIGATAANVCMETSFGVESVEPRTHVLPKVPSPHGLNLQLVPGSMA